MIARWAAARDPVYARRDLMGSNVLAARDLTKARTGLADAMSSAAKAAAKAHADGMTEVDLAQHLGVNRLTIRKWLGK